MKKSKKKFIILGIILIIAVSAGLYLRGANTQQPMGNFVKTETVEKRDVSSTIYSTGKVVSVEEKNIYTDLEGKVVAILVQEGDKVKKGDVLAELESEGIKSKLLDAEIVYQNAKTSVLKSKAISDSEAAYEKEKAAYEEALNTFENNKILNSTGAISDKEFEESRNAYKNAYNSYIAAKTEFENNSDVTISELKYEGAKAQYESLKREYEKTKIVSPIDGTVTIVNLKHGEKTDPSKEIFRVETVDNLKVEISIGEYDVNRVKIGQKTMIRGDGIGDEKYSGEIIKIAPIAYSESGGQSVNNVVPVEVKINESNTKFKPNFSANVEIEVASVKDAITIPFEAMARDKDGSIFVFVVEDNIAIKKNIKTGVEGELYLEVAEGDLKEGDMIIINPAANIQDGSEVIVGGGI